MKHLKIFSLLFLVAALMVLTNCGKDDTGPKIDPQLQAAGNSLIAGEWVPTSVTFQGSPRAEWDQFKLSFTVNEEYTGGTYTSTGYPEEDEDMAVWKASGTWSFVENSDGTYSPNKLIKDGNETEEINMVVLVDDPDNPTSGDLSLVFFVAEPSARTAFVGGEWEFNMEF